MKKLTILVLVVSFIALLYGCCSSAKDNIFVNPKSDVAITSRKVITNASGTIPTITFPSGAIFVGSEEGTLKPDTEVVIIEQETTSQNMAYFTDSVSSNLFTYKINVDSSTSKGGVITIEKPVRVTLPANIASGVYYLGTRDSDTDPWRFRKIDSLNNNAEFDVHKIGSSFCLIVNDENSKNKLPATVVDSFAATSTPSISVNDGKYTEDLQINGLLEGSNLGNINPADLVVRVSYRNNSSKAASIKVNNTIAAQSDKADKTVPGYTYCHSFEVNAFEDLNLTNNNGNFAFTLNLKDVDTSSFPSGFILECYNKISGEKVLPFSFTEFYSVNVAEPLNIAIESYNITYILDGGNFVLENPTQYGEASDTIELSIPIKDGYTFLGWTGSNGNTPQINVSIEHGSTGDKSFTANWAVNQTNSFSLSLKKGTGIDEVSGGGTKEAGESVVATCTMLAGYEFDFWTGNITESEFTMPNHDVVMQANARLKNYTLVYELNGGNTVPDNLNYYNISYDDFTLVNPTRLGYTFIGWSGTGLTGNNNLVVTVPHGSIGDREYTANWSLNTYTITIEMGEGNVATPNFTTYDVASGNITLNNPVSSREYYQFTGWSGTDLEGNNNLVVTIPQGSVGDRVYTANYTPESFAIQYELNNGTATNPLSYDISSVTFALINPIKEGYDFLGWEGTDIPQGTASKTVIIYNGSHGERNYVASFTPRYTITYNLDGGTNTINPLTYNIYSNNLYLSEPTKAGDANAEYYVFAGWTGTDIDSATKTVNIPLGSSGDREYTAHWIEEKEFMISNDVSIIMVKIASGTFTMGCSTDEVGYTGNESPPHQVTLTKDFYIGKFEVTQDQYFAVMGTNPSNNKTVAPDVRPTTTASYPVELVSWDDAQVFIDWMNTNIPNMPNIPAGYHFDFPTEAQWEYACRAGTTTSLNNGKNLASGWVADAYLAELGWYASNCAGSTQAVGQKIPNAWDLYDMHGNVWEWTKDYPFRTYTADPCVDPFNDNSGGRVIRGGGWQLGSPTYCRSAHRNALGQDGTRGDIGFRLALVKN